MTVSVEERHPKMRDIVDYDAEILVIGEDFGFTEGPVWHPERRHLLFSDIPNSTLWRWTERGGLEVYRRPSNMANGNTWDERGRLLSCEHATSRVVREESDGTITALVATYDGKDLNSPNDIVCSSRGDIYFSDPDFGRREFFGVARDKDQTFQGVYAIPRGSEGSPVLIASQFEQPNGVAMSPDQTRLFVNDTPSNRIWVYRVHEDGTVDDGSEFGQVEGEGIGRADGLKTDLMGNVYCTGPGGIHVFDPSGTCLGVIHLPQQPANFTFGGDDHRHMFGTARTGVYRFRMLTVGWSVISRKPE